MKPERAAVVPVMKVQIWSDVVCPWCYIGKRRFEAALADFAHRDEVEVVWRAFELDPDAPRRRLEPYAERLAAKYQMSVAEARAALDHMSQVGRDNGLDLNFGMAQPGNTFDAHRVLHLGLDAGCQDELKERLLAGHFTEGRAIAEPDTLVALAAEVGLDPGEVRAVLAGDRYAAQVRADEQQAVRYGIHAVPFFVVDGRYGVAGAQPPELLLRVLEDAWDEAEEDEAEGDEAPSMGAAGGDAVVCGDDACVIG
jgi:predicted DsbA family dithiol-disulfide isomerase